MAMKSALPLKEILFCCVALVGVRLVMGEDPTGSKPTAIPPGPVQSSEGEEVLAELKQIREKLGGSVLRGSLLDNRAPSDDVESDSELRSLLGLPESKPTLSGPRTAREIIVLLRKHSARIDRIANGIESLREYKNADELRDTARELRMIARQIDVPKDRGRDR